MYPVARWRTCPPPTWPVPRARDGGLRQRLVRAFPNITSVDMSSTINQVQRVLDQVIRAVEFLFGFALLAAG
jgi:putative ABC transport system permease protein